MGSTSASGRRPISLGAAILTFIIILSLLLVALLQSLLVRNNRNNGLLFANDPHALPIPQIFSYFYAPTVVAVFYGLMWTWIDLDIRRLEPFYQLARPDGALGRDSLLLRYPVGFILTVPWQAFRRGHYRVFLASSATLLALWGLTPIQAGIFTVSTVTRSVETAFAQSSGYVPAAAQIHSLSTKNVQSVSNILWLDETLRPYMTKEYILAPFAPKIPTATDDTAEVWISRTKSYSANVTCEKPIYWYDGVDPVPHMNSSFGCHMFVLDPRTLPNLYDEPERIYNARFMSYWPTDRNSAEYLQAGICPANATHTFVAQWSKSLVNGTEFSSIGYAGRMNYSMSTNRYCQISYHVQDVVATVSATQDHRVLAVEPIGDPSDLPTDMFNTTAFEINLGSGKELPVQRTSFPTPYWPDQQVHWTNTSLHYNDMEPITWFALAAHQVPFDEYRDPGTLDAAYRAAVQLFFARQFADVLSLLLDNRSIVIGSRVMTTRAIVMVPAFTYITEALLATIALLALGLLVLLKRSSYVLQSDISSIASLMHIAAQDETLLNTFKPMDRLSPNALAEAIERQRFKLERYHEGSRTGLTLLREPAAALVDTSLREPLARSSSTLSSVQPSEYSMKAGLLFVAAQVAVFTGILIVYRRSVACAGLPLPSDVVFLRRLLDSYVPLGLVTLLESVWTVLNRHLCTLQPFEALRRGDVDARRSIELNYSASPPQFAIWNAIRNRHTLLAVVCFISYLANILSISMSGLFYEGPAPRLEILSIHRPYQPQFVSLNGSSMLFTRDHQGSTNPFYIATSNITAATPLPPWVDDQFFYLPFETLVKSSESLRSTRALTHVVGSKLQCQAHDASTDLVVMGPISNNLYALDISTFANLTLHLPMNDGTGRNATCGPRGNSNLSTSSRISPFNGSVAMEINEALTNLTADATPEELAFCRERMAAAWIRADAEHVETPLPDGLTNSSFDIRSWTTTMIICRPEIVYGTADVSIDPEGRILQRHSVDISDQPASSLFSRSDSTARDLISQAYLFFPDESLSWHLDDYPTDFMNYLLAAQWNDTSALDHTLPPPSADIIIPRYEALFNMLFAIMLGHNMDALFVPSNSIGGLDNSVPDSALPTDDKGTTTTMETRIFMSVTFVVIAEVILGCYIGTTVCLYLLRPWRILVRMPDSPADIIAYFAASRAVLRMRSKPDPLTAVRQLPDEKDKDVLVVERELDEDLSIKNMRYSFGAFSGTDGKMKVGIEEAKYVTLLTACKGATAHSGSNAISRWFIMTRQRNRRKVTVAQELRRRSRRSLLVD